ncbi:MAG: hypothetical protein JNL05_01390 [Flavobacteriales bacterium]|nr:hypothetical protein [Flavobacteriales bacterium]
MMAPRTLLFLALLTFSATPGRAQVAEAGPDTSLCVNFYTMQGSQVPIGATGAWTLVMGCGTINAPNDPASPITNMCIGSNVFVWTVDDGGTITTDIVVITVYDTNMPAANAGVDQTIIGPQNWAQLSGWPAPIYPATCLWSVVSATATITDPTDPNTTVAGLSAGANTFCWTCDNGPCGTTSDTVTVQMMMITGLSDDEAPVTGGLLYDATTGRIGCLGQERPQQLVVMDVHGRTVPIPASGDLSGLAAGAYVLRALVADRWRTLRFIVER